LARDPVVPSTGADVLSESFLRTFCCVFDARL